MNAGGGWHDPQYGNGDKLDGRDWILFVCLAVLAILIAALLASAAPRTQEEHTSIVMMRVLVVSKDGKITAQPYVAPIFDLKATEGFTPKEKDVLRCLWQVQNKAFDDHADNFISFVCTNENDGTGALKKTLMLTGLGFEQ